jgi:hypothetical protein
MFHMRVVALLWGLFLSAACVAAEETAPRSCRFQISLGALLSYNSGDPVAGPHHSREFSRLVPAGLFGVQPCFRQAERRVLAAFEINTALEQRDTIASILAGVGDPGSRAELKGGVGYVFGRSSDHPTLDTSVPGRAALTVGMDVLAARTSKVDAAVVFRYFHVFRGRTSREGRLGSEVLRFGMALRF